MMSIRHKRIKDHSGTVQIIVFLLLVGCLFAIDHFRHRPTRPAEPSSSAVVEAYASRATDVWVEGEGRVVKVLQDDLEGSRHQRMIVEIEDGHTILIAHNIDLAPRVPLAGGEEIAFKGEYVWNEKGGILHWTHHDPDGRYPGGWIRVDGKSYR